MASDQKQYANRRWIENDGYYLLEAYFYDDWREVLRMRQDEDDKALWIMSSKRMNIEFDYLDEADTLEKAKEGFELKYTEYLEDQLRYYEDLINAWEEELWQVT